MKPLELAALERELSAFFEAYPEMKDDETLRADMLAGSTDVFEILAGIVSEMHEARTLAIAVNGRIAELDERASRFTRREKAMKALAFRIMQAAGLKKAPLAEATLSVRNLPASVIITDESELPDDVFNVKTTRTVNKDLIKEKLKAGEFVPGATLSNGGSTLAVL